MHKPGRPASGTIAPDGQPRNPLHGVTLERIVSTLADHYGWAALAQRIPVRCFSHDPSIASSLKFLRKTPWARAKVETLWVNLQRAARPGAASPSARPDWRDWRPGRRAR